MNSTLDSLAEQELKLYQEAINSQGSLESKAQQLRDGGVFAAYKGIHMEYLALFEQTQESSIKLEALKRLIFLNWYVQAEHFCFTGINELDEETISTSFRRLNEYIVLDKLDKEFTWMLSYYSSWEWIILEFSEPELTELTAFVKAVDISISHFKQNQPELMVNRGQMGIYWQSHDNGHQ